MDLVVLFKGFAMGVILAVTTPPGTLWMVQVGYRRGWAHAIWAGLGLAVGFAFLTLLVAYCLVLLFSFWAYIAIPVRVAALLILGYLGWKSFRAKKLKTLGLGDEVLLPKGGPQLMQQTAYILVTMPMRVPAVFGYMVATAVLYRLGGPLALPILTLGVLLGAMAWSLFICLLGRVAAKLVEDRITLRSLNKLHKLAGGVYFVLAFLTFSPQLERALFY